MSKFLLDIRIRPAVLDDTPSIATLYAHYVRNSIVTFELEPPSPADIVERIAQSRARGLDWLVCETGAGELVGYAYARPYKAERPAYDCTVEISVYLRHVDRDYDETPAWTGRGIGRKLVTALLESIRSVKLEMSSQDTSHAPNTRRYRQVLAVQARARVSDDGERNINGFYRSLGFQLSGTLRDVGYKLGTWADVDFWQMDLGQWNDK